MSAGGLMVMLHWFPTPYPDELLYSVLARYHVRSGNTSAKTTTAELFGKRSIRSVLDLPANLNVLVNRIGSNWDAESLIFHNTMYPYYASFLLPKQADQVKQSMKDNKGSTIHTRIGVSASNVQPKVNLWVCSDCIKEDMDALGETYWHRVHQAPGVFVCPKHEVILGETNVPVKAKNQHEYMIASPLIERKQFGLDELQKEDFCLLNKIAQITEFLLEQPIIQLKDKTLRERYLTVLKKKGLAGPNGYVKREKVYQNFASTFSGRCLELMQSSILLEETNWLTMIFQKHRKSFHPIRHILVLLFLELDMNQLFIKEEYYPFGLGPWKCLNVACPHFHKPVVTSLKITICYDTRKPVGTFSCDCGFTYSRRGPDKTESDQYRIGTIKEYGLLWKSKLTSLVNEKKTLTKISKELKADRATIKKYAFELELDVPWKLPQVEEENSNKYFEVYEKVLLERKNHWLKLQELYPEKSKTQLRKLAPNVYAYLYRNNPRWLSSHSPKKKRTHNPNKRVNWEKRDEELLRLVKEVARNWDVDTNKPTRISISSIGRKINSTSLLQKKAEKLPKTSEYIQNISEDLSTFQIRRVEAVIKQLKRENERIVEWEVYRLAGLKSNISNEVKRFITMKVTGYESV